MHYVLDGSTIVAETRKDEYGTVTHQFYYYYDENGAPIGLNWNGQDYYYYKNIFGDILGIFNSAGTLVVRYSYDAWGNSISRSGSMANTLGIYNPFRYRGYYYDNETGMYYLNARYYNPSWCRFISADEPQYLGADGLAVGYNLFCYCFNDPVNYADHTGNWPKWIKKAVGWVKENIIDPVVEFCEDIVEDVKNFDIDNQSEDTVFESNYISGYKGALVIKTPLDTKIASGGV